MRPLCKSCAVCCECMRDIHILWQSETQLNSEQIVWRALSSLVSRLAGVAVSTFYYRRHEQRKSKLDTLKRFMANRYDLTGDEFSRALNEIFIAYHGSAKVRSALNRHHKAVTTPGADSEDELVALIRSMCHDVNVSYREMNDFFFLRHFNTRRTNW